MKNSRIEWTTHTFNPWIGCTKVSPGCAHCYAATLDHRWGRDRWGPGKPREVTSDEYWRQPLRWDRDAAAAGRRDRVFCASLADVFDEEAPDGALQRLWDLIRATRSLDWLLLTKRPERIRDNLPTDWSKGWANVWLGTSVEDQRRAEERIPYLLDVPARIHFLSCEPLLGPIHLRDVKYRLKAGDIVVGGSWRAVNLDALAGYVANEGHRRVDWVIVGGESGHGARPMHPAWAWGLRDQCVESGTAFHFKQWGEWAPVDANLHPVHDDWCRGRDHFDAEDWPVMIRVGKKAAGRVLDGRTWDDFPVGGVV